MLWAGTGLAVFPVEGVAELQGDMPQSRTAIQPGYRGQGLGTGWWGE